MAMRQEYKEKAVPALATALGLASTMAVPRIVKVVVNVGIGASTTNPKLAETVEQSLTRMTGQRPVRTLARKSIATYKIRKGMAIGMMVTLRGQRMWDFLERLVRVTIPRIRDFRGLSKTSVDQQGNLSLGFREHVVFPEIRPDEVEQLHGVQVTITTDAGSRARGLALFESLGFPFRGKE